MNNTPDIKYTPLYTPEDLRERLIKLSEALSNALQPLQCLQGCGAAEIADEEACYVQEMRGFVDLVRLVGEEELTEAIRSANKACWEIEVANEESATDVEHPWFGEVTGGSYDTKTFFTDPYFEFGSLDYGPIPEADDEEEEQTTKPTRPSPHSSGKAWSHDFSDF